MDEMSITIKSSRIFRESRDSFPLKIMACDDNYTIWFWSSNI